MALTSALHVFIVGTCGGIVLEFFHWYSLRRDARYPTYGTRVSYWVLSAIMAAVGGLIALIYFGASADAIVAFHVGLSAPLILQKLTSTIALPPGAMGVSKIEWLDFLRW